MKRIIAAVATAAAILGAAVAPAQAAPLTQADVTFLKLVTAYTTEPRPAGVSDADLVEVGQYTCYVLRSGNSVDFVRSQFRTPIDYTFAVISAATTVYCPDQRGRFLEYVRYI
ncbi:hypothetical protein TPA2_gp14 [Tsukamurella phage TPA2]|uniref:hypothetical protein n=1 Tax=Tsukamurella phage TPA2 TaxID=981330 RepID=UPI0001FF8DA5|nr:hypothetical protein TPA2_gp14 [Tsukamurella phage TPA2]ADX31928.1 hypothetical protein [Tsukamurella phage TPA2]